MSKDKKQTAEKAKAKEEKAAAPAVEEIKDPAPDTAKAAPEETPKETSKEAQPQDKPEEAPAPEEKKPAPDGELAALTDRYLRICAEYDNFRKRSLKERDALYGDVKADTLRKFLPVYDNLVRALAQSTEDEAYRKGVEMIMTQFNSTMEKLGVTEIDCLGKAFDPALHNAVMHVDDEEKGENEIVEVFQKGFIMGGKVIRFAMVKVAN